MASFDFAEVQNFHRRKIAQSAPLPFEQFRSGPAFLKIVLYLSAEHNYMKNNLASFFRLYYTSLLGWAVRPESKYREGSNILPWGVRTCSFPSYNIRSRQMLLDQVPCFSPPAGNHHPTVACGTVIRGVTNMWGRSLLQIDSPYQFVNELLS